MQSVVPITRKWAEQYVSYAYAPPYTFYNIPEEYRAEEVEELISPASAAETFAVLEDGLMIGFYMYTHDPVNDTVELGLGLAPEKTGQGRGTAFVRESLAFYRGQHPDFRGTFTLRVADFNLRARSVYENCGFRVYDRQYAVSYGTTPVTFLCMRLEANAIS